MPEGLEDRDLLGRRAPWMRSHEDVAELGGDVILADRALSQRDAGSRPTSFSADSRLSATNVESATVAESSSRVCGKQAPTALMCAPSAIHSRSITGSAELVTVTMTSAP